MNVAVSDVTIGDVVVSMNHEAVNIKVYVLGGATPWGCSRPLTLRLCTPAGPRSTQSYTMSAGRFAKAPSPTSATVVLCWRGSVVCVVRCVLGLPLLLAAKRGTTVGPCTGQCDCVINDASVSIRLAIVAVNGRPQLKQDSFELALPSLTTSITDAAARFVE